MALDKLSPLQWQQAVDSRNGTLVTISGAAETQLFRWTGIKPLGGEYVSDATPLKLSSCPRRPLVRASTKRGAVLNSAASLSPAVYSPEEATCRRYPESPSNSLLLPLLEVDRCTAAVTEPLPRYDFRGAHFWTKASSWTKLGERTARHRRQRRKLRGCGDCNFCNDCALPLLDGVLCCLSTLLLPCLDGILPDAQASRPTGKYADCDRATESFWGTGEDLFKQIFLEHREYVRAGGGPTIDTICLRCGDILQSRRLDSRSFVDALSPDVCHERNKSQKEESRQKIPLPCFSEARGSPPSRSEVFPDVHTIDQSGKDKRERRPWSCRETKHSAFPKDEAGRVVLPAFFLDKQHVAKKTFPPRK